MASLAFSNPTSFVVFSSTGSSSSNSFRKREVLGGGCPAINHCTGRKTSTVTNVASDVRPSAAPLSSDNSNGTKHAAWTSVPNEYWSGELDIEGRIPSWVRGNYLRNGPGLFHVGDYDFTHLFDGYGTIVSLHFDNGRVVMSHRQIESEAYRAAKKHNKICYREFSAIPKPENFLAYVGDLSKMLSGASLTDNANSGVVELGDGRILCVTETIKASIEIDPETLATLGQFQYADDLGGLIQSAHPIVMDGDFFTLLPDLVNSGYSVVRMEAGSNERKVIGKIKCRGGSMPGWAHAFPVTQHYVIVPEMPLRYSAAALLKSEKRPLFVFDWLPESKGFMHVMCKASGKIVASVEVPVFMTFHYINAYEEKDEQGRITNIIIDCCEHNADTTILNTLRMENLRSFAGQDTLPDARIGRFTLPLDGNPYGKLETALDPNEHGRAMDMGTVNPNYIGKKHRYAYACSARRPCNFPNILTKLDLVNKKVKKWYDKDDVVPSEPFFLPRPGATEEDDGVVISLISEKDGGGYAVVLDGRTFEEIARAKFPYGLPYGFHGCWIPRD